MAREQVIEIVAEMVANVMSVAVAPGDRVEAGDTVVLLESMKMEIPVLLEAPGTVRAVKVAPGDVVQEGDVLVEIVCRLTVAGLLAEGAGFEPAVGLPTTAFKAVPIGHSGTPPCAPWPGTREV